LPDDLETQLCCEMTKWQSIFDRVDVSNCEDREIVNANGASDVVVLQLGPLRKMLTSHLFATRREAAAGLREVYGRAQRLETVRMV